MDTQSESPDLYTHIDEDNIAWLHFDKQNASTNVLSASVLEAFYDELLELVERAPRGLVILSDKTNGFIAGADVNEFTRLENHGRPSAPYNVARKCSTGWPRCLFRPLP